MNRTDIHRILDATNARTVVKGRNLCADDAVIWWDETKAGLEGEVLSSNQYSSYEVFLEFDKNRKKIKSYSCECPAYYSYNGMCKHCVALLYEYMEHLKENEDAFEGLQELKGNFSLKDVSEKKTSDEFKEFLYEKNVDITNLIEEKIEEDNYIELEPFIKYGNNGLEVEFKVGSNQMYMINNVFDFLDRFENHEYYSYGKKLQFTHREEVLTTQAKKYYLFIEKWVEQNKEAYAQVLGRWVGYHYETYETFKAVRKMKINGRELERLLELVECKSVMYEFDNWNTKSIRLPIIQENFRRNFYIDKEKDGIYFYTDRIQGFKGEKYYVFTEKDGIFLVDRKKVEAVAPIIYKTSYRKEDSAFIANEDVPAFCMKCLPLLRDVLEEVSTDFREEDYVVETVNLKVYIDKVQEDMVSMRPIAVYGNTEISVYNQEQMLQKRNWGEEKKLAMLVNSYATAYDEKKQMMVIYENDGLLFDLLTQGIGKMQEIAEVYVSDSIRAMRPKNPPTISLGVAVESGVLDLDVKVENLSMEEMIEILSKYDKKKRYYRVKNGAFIQVDGSGLDEFANLQSSLALTDKQLMQGNITLPAYRAFLIEEQLKQGEYLAYERNRGFKQLIRSMKTIEESDFEIPSNMNVVLREYQKTGFLWMKTLKQNSFGGILADDMGLGKTVQVIAFLCSEIQVKKDCSVLIVSPASLVYNWRSELERFAPELSVTTVVGTANERRGIINDVKAGILLTSYDLLKRDILSYEDKKFDIGIIDEAQYIKNGGTLVTKAVKAINGKFKLALTGTPVENRLSELWSIFDYIMPGFLYTSKQFKDELESPIVKNGDVDKLEQLKKMVTPFILRRKKKDVLKDLPDKVEENRMMMLEKEQKKLYDAHVKRLQMTIGSKTDAEFKTSKLQILAELTKLRQICCEPRLFLDGYTSESAKLDTCMQLIENAVSGGHKILLFSQFTSMFEYIHQKLNEKGIDYYTLTGATSKEKRAQMVANFNSDDTPVFCISLKAGGTGLNLTSADIVIHYDPWWNVAVQDQATDRAHRIGQKQVVTVYKLIAKDTIEEKIVALQEKKKELADQILEGEGIADSSFSKDELLELLS